VTALMPSKSLDPVPSAGDSVLPGRPLNPQSPVPLYHQLEQVLVQVIDSGKLGPGDLVPSEHWLAETYGISRSTVRQALDELERHGYIYRQRGRGTLVSARPIYHGTTGVAGFSDDMKSQGIKPRSQVLRLVILPADDELAEHLRIRSAEDVVVAERLRFADDTPVCIERTHLPVAKVGAIAREDLEGGRSLYEHLRERLGIRPQMVEELLEVVFGDPEDCARLQVPSSSPLVRLQRSVYADTGDCIEYAISLWRIDRFRYVAWRTGSSHIAIRDVP